MTRDALLMQMSSVRQGRLLKGKWDWMGQTAREDGLRMGNYGRPIGIVPCSMWEDSCPLQGHAFPSSSAILDKEKPVTIPGTDGMGRTPADPHHRQPAGVTSRLRLPLRVCFLTAAF